MSKEQRVIWCVRLTVLGYLIGIGLSLRMWIGTREFPYSPILGLGELPSQIEYILLALLLIALSWIFVRPQRAFGIAAAIAILAVFAVFDQIRWRAAFYQYTLILLAVLSAVRLSEADKRHETALDTIRCVIAATYIWAGLQKFHITYITGVFPWMISTFDLGLPEGPMLALGFITPVIEASIGVALLSTRFRNVAVLVAWGMHLFVLLHIGPLGRNWNTFVWPWNLIMPSVAFFAFYRVERGTAQILRGGSSIVHYPILVLVGILPALNFFSLWDAYPSFSLYSGNVHEAKILLPRASQLDYPYDLQSIMVPDGEQSNQMQLGIVKWAVSELGLPPYPERRIYVGVFRKVCQWDKTSSELRLRIRSRPDRFTGKRKVEYLSCAQLE